MSEPIRTALGWFVLGMISTIGLIAMGFFLQIIGGVLFLVFSFLLQALFFIGVTASAGAGIGWLLDQVLGTFPLLTGAGSLLGAAWGFLFFMRAVRDGRYF
jgi:hypothetical protein